MCDTAEQDIADEMGVDVETLFDDDFQDRDGDDGDDGDDNDDRIDALDERKDNESILSISDGYGDEMNEDEEKNQNEMMQQDCENEDATYISNDLNDEEDMEDMKTTAFACSEVPLMDETDLHLSIEELQVLISDAVLEDHWTFLDNILMLTLQGHDASFDLVSSLRLWNLNFPVPTRKPCHANKHNGRKLVSGSELDFGSSFEPFVHNSVWNACTNSENDRFVSNDHSFVIHIAVKLNISPIVIDAFFRHKKGYCCTHLPRNLTNIVTNNNGEWIPSILLQCWPEEFENVHIFILEEYVDESKCDVFIQVQMFVSQHPKNDCGIQEIVLMRNQNSYTLLDTDLAPVLNSLLENDLQIYVMQCRDSLKSMAVSGIELPRINSSNNTTQAQLISMWKQAIKMVDLTQDKNGRWTTTPPGLSGKKHFQDGSLQDSGWVTVKNHLHNRLTGCQVNIVDFGSEGGYCIAQFAIDPSVKSVTGKEIQYPWVAYSALILFHLYTQSKCQNTYFASTKLLCGSFVDISDTIWMHAVANAHVIHCDNWNWWKGNMDKKDAILPKANGFSALQKSIDCNVAYLLRRLVKDDAYIVVYKNEYFNLGFELLQTFDVYANWNSVSSTSIHLVQLDHDNLFQCDSVTRLIAKKVFERELFQCDCGMPLIRIGQKLATKDNYICTNCEVCQF